MRHKLFSRALFVIAFAAFVTPALAQEDASARRDLPAPQTSSDKDAAASRATADENFELNIAERRITRENYSASTEVGIGEAQTHGVNLRVGVAVVASNIDVLLRNVRGRVRFRASLEELLQRINARRLPPPSSSASPAPQPDNPSP